MSNVFFFRLHKLRRQQEQDQERRQLQQQRRLSGASINGNGKGPMRMGRFRQLARPSLHCPSLVDSNVLTMVPGRLFERPATMDPSDSLDYIALQIPRVRVEYYVNENTFKERLQLYFIRNQRSSLRIRIFNLLIKLLTCLLYVGRVIFDNDPTQATCYGCEVGNKSEYLAAYEKTPQQFMDNPIIHWEAIWWIERPTALWVIEVIFALISLVEALLVAYLSYKGNILQEILSFYFILELVNTIPYVFTMFYSPLRHLFIPVFLNCWLAKRALENMFNDLHRAMQRSQSALSQQLMVLSATLLCLVFTSVCGVQHFQRAGHRHFNLFQSCYFVVVTFSTVGYGDYVPDIWPSQLYMVVMICVALIVLPTQFEQLAFTWMERKKLGGTYSSHRAQSERHVVVCSTSLHADTIMDFLNEFYAHPLLQDYYVVLLSPIELDTTMRMILQVPMWAQRVIYIQGSCLKDADLARARMNDAEACFVLAARNYCDKTAADEHTILRSWAVKDFAPEVPQYVQIFRPENKLHVKFAQHVVCEDEFKYALLANNCLAPGTSTLVTLLLHTSRGQEGQVSDEEWHRLYGKCSGNEIYHILLAESRFFGEYDGKSFTYASFHSHRKYGVALVGVRPAELPEFYEETILLNPGPRHIMKKTDICFYMSITKEENSAFVATPTACSSDPAAQMQQQPTSSSTQQTNLEAGVTSTPSGGFKSKETVLTTTTTTSGITSARHIIPTSRTQTSFQGNIYDGLPARCSSPNLFDTGMPRRGSFINRNDSVDSTTACSLGNQSLGNAAILGGGSNFLGVPKSDSPGLLAVPTGHCESRRPSILPVPDMFSGSTINLVAGHQAATEDSEDEIEDDVPWPAPTEKISIVKGFPPVSPYIGVSPTLCYLLKEKKPLCCLQLTQVCEHSSHRSAKEYNWSNKVIILAADYASTGIYNFVIPLRAHFRTKSSLNPIVLLLERKPDVAFLDSISYFPFVYWMLGTIDCLDDLIKAGIILAENVVVVNKEFSNSAEEDTLSDCNTIVSVQTMFKFFPSIKTITELSQSSNMRFMQFRAHDKYALHLSRMEKAEKERGSHISYMFRLPFAAGSVFSASMLDTLLYQAFVKDYVITFVRLLLGIDQAPGSGFLSSMKITKEDMWIRTYGRLYQKLCSTTCEIPIGIYRTQDTSNSETTSEDMAREDTGCADIPRRGNYEGPVHSRQHPGRVSLLTDEARDNHTQLIERAEIASLVRSRMDSLGIDTLDYDDVSEKRSSLSYVIINPSCDLKLEEGDIIYLIRPSPFSAQKTFERHNSRRRSHINICEERRRRNSTKPMPQKANSLSLPDSPDISLGPPSGLGANRGRSHSLRVDDILMRRSSSLRQGLIARNTSSVEEVSLNLEPSVGIGGSFGGAGFRGGSIKIPLNGSIGLEVTPPADQQCSDSEESLDFRGTIV
ncbi:potassium channel subfamily T member 2-like isoform X1 [Daphnia pulex]|uniref:potassium channel subfamily T member 2-like isoform X1 n=1 Tax=Daphnia pulex TaxID=6669 RepID=UPI001EDDB864|nr:potassium channel subfamily T member 2-like isoform X1 [Daphnia pulex]